MIILPDIPFAEVTIKLHENVWAHKSMFGGPDQIQSRIGGRWTVTVKVPDMKNDQGRALATDLAEGITNKVRYRIPSKGNTTTNGTVSSGAGKTLAVVGSNPKKGDYFSLIHDGKCFLHRVVSNSSGTLLIQPSLKVVPTSGDQVIFESPMIEGFITTPDQSYDTDVLEVIFNVTFEISEAQ
jgi:hypothetical protein